MSFFSNLFSARNDSVSPEQAATLVAEGKAVLIDVREADEWAETGVAEPALTLAMSELRGGSGDWPQVLESNKDRQILLYCHSGGRSDRVASHLRSQGFQAFNVGGLGDWMRAGLPVRRL